MYVFYSEIEISFSKYYPSICKIRCSTSSIVTNTVDTTPMTTLSTSTTTNGVTSSQSTTKIMTSTTIPTTSTIIPTTSLMTTAPNPWCLSYLWNGGFNHGWLWSSWSCERWWRMLIVLKGHWIKHFRKQLRKLKKQLWRKQHWKRYPHCMFIVILYFEHHTPSRVRHDITEILLKLTLSTNQSINTTCYCFAYNLLSKHDIINMALFCLTYNLLPKHDLIHMAYLLSYLKRIAQA